MPTNEIKFGTDGWRATIAEDYTFENVRACGQAVAQYLQDTNTATSGLVVGYDTRFASEDFAMAVATVVASNGIKVYLSDRPSPTPVVSYNIIYREAAGGVVITASHNPSTYNGFKYKAQYGGSASPEVVTALEQRIAAFRAKESLTANPQPTVAIEKIDAETPYLEHISKLVDLQAIKDSGLNVVVDSMYGAGSGLFARLLKGGKTRITEIHSERNPAFPGMGQPEPVTQNLKALAQAVTANKADVGLATDGDADRLGVMDENGQFVTQLQVVALLALYFLDSLGQRGPMVKSITTTSMLFKLGELYKVPVHETPVGFKYVGAVMMKENALLGGEESGGYAFRGHIPERDGILSGLHILAMMTKLMRRPTQLLEYLYGKVGPHYYDRIDLRFDSAQRQNILDRLSSAKPAMLGGSVVSSIDAIDGYRYRLQDGSWALIRFSGTEPLLRVYCETSSEQRVQEMLQDTRALAGV